MSVSFLVLIPLAVFGLVVVGGIAALCNKRTRWLGYLLLLLPVGLLALFLFQKFGFAVLGGIAAPMKWGIGMPVVAILVVGSIAALVALLVNKRTRPIGFVLLAVPAVIGCLAVVAMFYTWEYHRNAVPATRVQAMPIEDATSSPLISQEAIPVPAAPKQPVNKTAEPKKEEPKPENGLETKKSSAVAESANAADTSNEKQPSDGKTTKAPAKPADKKSPKPARKVPDWIGASPMRVGSGYQMVIRAGPWSTREECEQATNKELTKAVSEYAVKYFGTGRGRMATLEPSFLREHVIKEQWEDIHDYSVGPMNHIYTRLVFGARANTELEASYRRAIIEERLWMAGGGLGAILIVLAACFAVLKFDQSTGGNYRRWMVVLIIVGVAVILWVWVRGGVGSGSIVP